MSSRIRGDNQLFEVFVEAHRSFRDDGQINTDLSFMYPENVQQDVLNSVMKFVFPFDMSFKSSSVDCFTFVLTDGDSIFKFGFCRLSAESNVCHCIVSYYPWFEVFYRLLNHLVDLKRSNDQPLSDLTNWLDRILVKRRFVADEIVNIDAEPCFKFTVPDPSQLMTIPTSINLTEYFCAVDVKHMMDIFASTLFERRIIVTSKRLSRLTACIHSASSFLLPFHWQHIFIPILPPHLLDYCSAPMPFLIGVHSSMWSKINKEDLGDVVILDADDNSVHSSFNDLAKLPQIVVAKLKKQLGKGKSYCPEGDLIPRAFLRVIASLFGGYRMAFKTEQGKIVFDENVFVSTRPLAYQPFLKCALQFQIFQQFIEERLILMNSGRKIYDLFEEEIKNLDSQENQKGKNSRLDYKFIRFLKKSDKSRFTSFLGNFVGGCSSSAVESSNAINMKTLKSQTPTTSKKFLQRFPRKMSANYVGDIVKDNSKMLSTSNSSEGFHLEQSSPLRDDIQVMSDVGSLIEHEDDVNWSEPLSASSSYEAFQEGELRNDFQDILNKFSKSLENMALENISKRVSQNKLVVDPIGPHAAIANEGRANHVEAVNASTNNAKPAKKIQHLINMYESKETTKSTSKHGASNAPVFPDTYFPPHLMPSSIAARRADLQASTEQWKKHYRSRNIAEVQPVSNPSSNSKSITQSTTADNDAENTATDIAAKQSVSAGNLSLDSSLYLNEHAVPSEGHTSNQPSEQSNSNRPKRAMSGLSRRSAFKASKSLSSSESQRSSIYRKSLKDSLDMNSKIQSPTTEESDSDDNYLTPPSLPSSSPPLGDDDFPNHLHSKQDVDRSETKRKCLTLGTTRVQNQFTSDDNLSLRSANSFYSVSSVEDDKHFALPHCGVYAPTPFRKGRLP